MASPILLASIAFKIRAEKINSLAIDGFISLGKYWVPPAPGIMASLVSTNPRRVSDEATRMSHAKASSKPPPKWIKTNKVRQFPAQNRLRPIISENIPDLTNWMSRFWTCYHGNK